MCPIFETQAKKLSCEVAMGVVRQHGLGLHLLEGGAKQQFHRQTKHVCVPGKHSPADYTRLQYSCLGPDRRCAAQQMGSYLGYRVSVLVPCRERSVLSEERECGTVSLMPADVKGFGRRPQCARPLS